ncbi:P-loop containing nucleoside triphosphate hydrolase protein [Pilobolus umbonatus]|nr:P-loop containing nucleoside triphosphate hydrolase protein [Pilobolus umbonatus]
MSSIELKKTHADLIESFEHKRLLELETPSSSENEYQFNSSREESSEGAEIKVKECIPRRIRRRQKKAIDSGESSDSSDSLEDYTTRKVIERENKRAVRQPKMEYTYTPNLKGYQHRPTVHLPQYQDNDFISHHTMVCTSCQQKGIPNGRGTTSFKLGPDTKKERFLLCEYCSHGCHNCCLPVTTLKNFQGDPKNYVCLKCIKNTDCDVCDKRLGRHENGFRCQNCTRLFHPSCTTPPNSEQLFRNGLCHLCTSIKDVPESVLGEREVNGKGEVLVKWKNKPYRHASWISLSWFKKTRPSLYMGYVNKKEKSEEYRELMKKAQVPLEWTLVDRILDVEWEDSRKTKVKRILAVFRDTDYSTATWDDPPKENDGKIYTYYKKALERHKQSLKVKPPHNIKALIADVRRLATAEKYEKHEIKSQPTIIKGGKLMKHQLEALNWLMYEWEKQQSCVLADDMGLGKTIQVITFLLLLYKKFQIYPFIVVVPNSTATNWLREFEKWAGEMTVAPYFGGQEAYSLAEKYEIFDQQKRLKCHVVVCTYESVMQFQKIGRIFWPVMIVDESQRLKNDVSLLPRTLKTFNVDHKILLTGTPLQNNLKELFNIMNFIRPQDFEGIQAQDYDDMTTAKVEELHSRLRPYFLRRTKEEVLKTLPPKYEIIVPLSMTSVQKELYKAALNSDLRDILAIESMRKKSKGMTSVLMNLRKILNHPYLIDGVEIVQPSRDVTHREMINACEKLKMFHAMFPKLKADGHRILVFSTMTRTLDILEDYLAHENIKYTRIDGSCSERERVRSIDAFNAPESDLDVFLLSTRAGGVGINLATADTVIIWDSDYNPYADAQAIGRAHRIGQAKMVLILRFMTRLSVEEKILQIGKKKMALEHVVVERMTTDDDEPHDVESILKFGAQALFEESDSNDIVYDTNSIDKLLDREQYLEAAENQKQEEIELAEKTAEGSIGNFSFAKVWRGSGVVEDLVEEEDKPDDFWEKFLEQKQQEAEAKKEADRLAALNLGRGARKRAKVKYIDGIRAGKTHDKDGDYEFQPEEDDPLNLVTIEEDDSDLEMIQEEKPKRRKVIQRIIPPEVPPHATQGDRAPAPADNMNNGISTLPIDHSNDAFNPNHSNGYPSQLPNNNSHQIYRSYQPYGYPFHTSNQPPQNNGISGGPHVMKFDPNHSRRSNLPVPPPSSFISFVHPQYKEEQYAHLKYHIDVFLGHRKEALYYALLNKVSISQYKEALQRAEKDFIDNEDRQFMNEFLFDKSYLESQKYSVAQIENHWAEKLRIYHENKLKIHQYYMQQMLSIEEEVGKTIAQSQMLNQAQENIQRHTLLSRGQPQNQAQPQPQPQIQLQPQPQVQPGPQSFRPQAPIYTQAQPQIQLNIQTQAQKQIEAQAEALKQRQTQLQAEVLKQREAEIQAEAVKQRQAGIQAELLRQRTAGSTLSQQEQVLKGTDNNKS